MCWILWAPTCHWTWGGLGDALHIGVPSLVYYKGETRKLFTWWNISVEWADANSIVIYFRLQASQVALVIKNPSANAGGTRDTGSIPRLGRSPGEGHGNPLQYSCLENPWTEEPGGLQIMESQKAGHDWSSSSSSTLNYKAIDQKLNSPYTNRNEFLYTLFIFDLIFLAISKIHILIAISEKYNKSVCGWNWSWLFRVK